jgi:hypothetical protein
MRRFNHMPMTTPSAASPSTCTAEIFQVEITN